MSKEVYKVETSLFDVKGDLVEECEDKVIATSLEQAIEKTKKSYQKSMKNDNLFLEFSSVSYVEDFSIWIK